MIKIENTEIYGWEAAIRGMRNPMNSWDKSDSICCADIENCHSCRFYDIELDTHHCIEFAQNPIIIGPNDHALMMKLAKAGPTHAKYRRMITVTCDITAPLFLLKQADTYKVGTVCNSCSTMHKIHAKKFSVDDFSIDGASEEAVERMNEWIEQLNMARNAYLERKNEKYWRDMIIMLPESYNQRRTYQFNYEVLSSIYRDRKNHKLSEWHDFCDWIKSLPYSELITGDEAESDE